MKNKGNPDWVKGGKSPNAKGRPKGSKSAFIKSSIFLEAARDVEDRKRFLRAIINGDEDILPDYEIDPSKVTVNNKLEARKQLNVIYKDEVALETARQAEREAEKRARAAAKAEAKPVFSMVASIRAG